MQDVKTGQFYYFADRDIKWFMEMVCQLLKKLHIPLPYDLVIVFLGIYQGN